jgi:glycosyltransferase involved in cell wall biosynthesis
LSSAHPAFDIRIFHREAKTLFDAGYKVYIIATHNKEEIVEGIHIIPLSKRKNRFYRFFIKDWSILFKSIRINAMVYHFNNPDLILIGLMLKLIGKKVIYDVYENVCGDILSKEWIFPPIRKVISLITKFIEWFSLHFFDAIIVAGKDIQFQSHFRKFHNKIVLIRNFPTITFSGIEIFPKPKDKIRFIYTGGMSSIRGIMEIIEAYKSLGCKNSELILLGNFSNADFKNKIMNKIDNFVNIKYISAISYKEMFDLLKKCHVGLICFKPALNHINALSGRNNKIYEYMLAGLAIIGSNFESWNNFILGNKIGITVNPCDISEINKAMKFLIDNPNELKIMEENAKKMSIKYSWKLESHKLIDLYKDLCD